MRRRMTVVVVAISVLASLLAPAAGGAGGRRSTLADPVVAAAAGAGYWMIGLDGSVYAFGAAVHHGATASDLDTTDLEPTPSGAGYWVLETDGTVHAFGDAVDLGGTVPAAGELVTGLSSTPTGQGYWLFTDRGRVVARGDATTYGDMSGVPLNGPVIDAIATPTGLGYYMVASDGGIFSFGDAVFHGSMGGIPLNGPVVGLSPTPAGAGYWLVADDGGIFAFGDAAFRGSMGGIPLNRPVNGMVPYGDGYLMVASDGGIFNFSDLPFLGSLGSTPPPFPVVGVAPLPSGRAASSIGPGGGALSIPAGEDEVTVRVPAGALDGAVTVTAALETTTPRTAADIVDDDPTALSGLLDADLGAIPANPLWDPVVIATRGSELATAIRLGPAGTRFDRPVEVRIPLSSLGAAGSDVLVGVVESEDGTIEAVPTTIAGGHLVLELDHFSWSKIWRIPTRFIANPFARPSNDRYRQALSTLAAGPLDGISRDLAAQACRADVRFDDRRVPSMFNVLDYLGFEQPLDLEFPAGALDRLTARIRARFDPTTRGPAGGRHVTLAELVGWATDEADGDIFVGLVLAHDTLRFHRNSISVQNVMERVRGDGGDEKGARYHLLGTAIYAFAHRWAADNDALSFYDLSPRAAVRIEEAWVSGDIETDAEEYAVDLEGNRLGRHLYEVYRLTSAGEGSVAARDDYIDLCERPAPEPIDAERTPGDHTIYLVEKVTQGGAAVCAGIPDPYPYTETVETSYVLAQDVWYVDAEDEEEEIAPDLGEWASVACFWGYGRTISYRATAIERNVSRAWAEERFEQLEALLAPPYVYRWTRFSERLELRETSDGTIARDAVLSNLRD